MPSGSTGRCEEATTNTAPYLGITREGMTCTGIHNASIRSIMCHVHYIQYYILHPTLAL